MTLAKLLSFSCGSESKGKLEVKDPEAEIKKYFHIPEGLDEADEEMVKGWTKVCWLSYGDTCE